MPGSLGYVQHFTAIAKEDFFPMTAGFVWNLPSENDDDVCVTAGDKQDVCHNCRRR